MSTKGVIGIQGLKTSGNELAFPPGTLTQADNVIIPSKGIAQSRRGQGQSPTIYIDNDASDTNSNRAKEMWQWGDHLFINYAHSSTYGLSLYENFNQLSTGTPTYHSIGSYTPPDASTLRMKFAALSKSAYWTTTTGLYTLDAPSGTTRSAGIPAPLDFLQSPLSSGLTGLSGNPDASGSWLPKDRAVAARSVIGWKDANDVVKLSKPNGRCVVVNPTDVVVASGSLVIASNVVTATVPANPGHNFHVGDVLNLSDSDGGVFTTTNNVVTSVTATTIVWAQTHADHTSGVSITLTSGAKSIQWVVLIPSGLTANSHFVQLYRTDVAATATTDPGDECFQCFERYITATDISNGYVVIADSGPLAPPGPPLPTNENSGEGIALGSNERPPLCNDLCVWDGRLWGGQTTDRHRLPMRLLGTGSPNGLQTNDVVCLNTRALELTSVVTQFGPTQNVQTMLSIMAYAYSVLNGHSSSFFRILMSGADDGTFGSFMLEEDGVGGSALYAATTRTTAFADKLATAIPVTEASTSRTGSTVTVTTASSHGFSTGDGIMLAAATSDANFPVGIKTPITVTGATTFTYSESGSASTMTGSYYVYALTFKSDNGPQPVRFSKQGEPEAWPVPNFIGGLPDGATVLRIKPTPDNGELLVFLKNGDVYSVSGQYPYFVRRVTGSTSLISADSLSEHADQLFGLTTQGAASIGGNGVSVVSGDVDDELRQLANDIAVGSFAVSEIFGLSYESDHQYQLWTTIPAAASDLGYASRCYVYDSMRGVWTAFQDTTRTCGLVFRGLDYMILGDASSNALRIERKAFNVSPDFYLSFADERTSATVSGNQPSVSTITMTSLPSWFVTSRTGAVVQVGSSFYRVTTATTDSSTVFTLVGTVSVTNGQTLKFFRPFLARVAFAMEASGIPGIEKSFREVQLHFGERLFSSLTVDFSNEHTSTPVSVTVTPGDTPVGTPVAHLSTLRVDVPLSMRRSALLKVRLSLTEAFGYFKLLGYSASSEPVSERTGK